MITPAVIRLNKIDSIVLFLAAEEIRVKARVGNKTTSRRTKECQTIGNETFDKEDTEILDGKKSSMINNDVLSHTHTTVLLLVWNNDVLYRHKNNHVTLVFGMSPLGAQFYCCYAGQHMLKATQLRTGEFYWSEVLLHACPY